MQPRDSLPQQPLAANAWRRARRPEADGRGGRGGGRVETERIRAGSAERGARWRSPRPMWRGGWAVLAPAHRSGSVPPAQRSGRVRLLPYCRPPPDDDRRLPVAPPRPAAWLPLCSVPGRMPSGRLCNSARCARLQARRSVTPSPPPPRASRPRARGRRSWGRLAASRRERQRRRACAGWPPAVASCSGGGLPASGRQRRRWRACTVPSQGSKGKESSSTSAARGANLRHRPGLAVSCRR